MEYNTILWTKTASLGCLRPCLEIRSDNEDFDRATKIKPLKLKGKRKRNKSKEPEPLVYARLKLPMERAVYEEIFGWLVSNTQLARPRGGKKKDVELATPHTETEEQDVDERSRWNRRWL